MAASETTIHKHPVNDTDLCFIIDPISRNITNPQSKKNMLMQFDHNSERFSFELDRYIEQHDMSLCNKVEVHYLNIDANTKEKHAGVYEVQDLMIHPDNEDKVVLTWLISGNATVKAGTLNFLISFTCGENGVITYRWNTNVNTSIIISKGMNNAGAIEQSFPDILTQWQYDVHEWLLGLEGEFDELKAPLADRNYAYEVAVKNGFEGTEDEWVLTMKGEKGDPGDINIIVSDTEPVTKPCFWFDTSALQEGVL